MTFKIQCKTISISWKFQHFALHGIGKSSYPANTVGYGDNCTLIVNFCRIIKTFYPAFNQFTDFGRVE